MGCTVLFTDTACYVRYQGKVILTGYKDPSTDLWVLPITPEAIKQQKLAETGFRFRFRKDMETGFHFRFRKDTETGFRFCFRKDTEMGFRFCRCQAAQMIWY